MFQLLLLLLVSQQVNVASHRIQPSYFAYFKPTLNLQTFESSNIQPSNLQLQTFRLSTSDTNIFTTIPTTILLLSFRCHLILFDPFSKSYLNQKGIYFCCCLIIPEPNKGRRKFEWCFENLMIAFDRVLHLRPVYKLKQ